MKLKPEVEASNVGREIWYALGVVDEIHRGLNDSFTSADLVVTSLRDGTHNPGSLHTRGLAADLRVRDLSEEARGEFFGALRARLAPLGFDVILELPKATAETTALHVHLEYQPKTDAQAALFLARSA